MSSNLPLATFITAARSFQRSIDVRGASIQKFAMVLSFTATKENATDHAPRPPTTTTAGNSAPAPYPSPDARPFQDEVGDTEANARHQPSAHTEKSGRLSPHSTKSVRQFPLASPFPTFLMLSSPTSNHAGTNTERNYESHKGRKEGIQLRPTTRSIVRGRQTNVCVFGFRDTTTRKHVMPAPRKHSPGSKASCIRFVSFIRVITKRKQRAPTLPIGLLQHALISNLTFSTMILLDVAVMPQQKENLKLTLIDTTAYPNAEGALKVEMQRQGTLKVELWRH